MRGTHNFEIHHFASYKEADSEADGSQSYPTSKWYGQDLNPRGSGC